MYEAIFICIGLSQIVSNTVLAHTSVTCDIISDLEQSSGVTCIILQIDGRLLTV